MASRIRIGGVAPGTVGGIQQFLEKLATIPDGLVASINADLNAGADELVGRIQEIAPVDAMEAHPGELRDSVHKEAGRHDLSVLVVEDAKDAKGRGYAPHVEYGHKTPNGKHVAAKPHFWPSVRVSKRQIRSRISRSVSRAVKAAAGT